MDALVYQKTPRVIFGSNTFINTPTILQHDDTPLISVVREEKLGFTTEFQIYHSDRTYLAKVRGMRIHPTEAGKKAGIEVVQQPGLFACTLAKRPVFEIRHENGEAFRTQAELHTPNGYFVKSTDGFPEMLNAAGVPLQIGGTTIMHCVFDSCRIGIWLRSDGSCGIGVG